VAKNAEMKGLKKLPKKKRPKMTMKESVQFVFNSKYIRNLATLVISYGMCISIVEVSWKAKLKLAFPDPNSYSSFMGNFSSATGIVTLVMMILGRTIFAKFGWRVAALVTPAVRLHFISLLLFITMYTSKITGHVLKMETILRLILLHSFFFVIFESTLCVLHR
jgi:ATP:ADP antiporter, AAA family